MNAWDEYKTVGSGAQLEECRVNETESTVNCTYSVDPERCDHLDDAGLRCQGKYPLTFKIHKRQFPCTCLSNGITF